MREPLSDCFNLTRDQTLWLLTAHPNAWKLDDAPTRLVAECINEGLALGLTVPPALRARADEVIE